jgi:hypothetical protein
VQYFVALQRATVYKQKYICGLIISWGEEVGGRQLGKHLKIILTGTVIFKSRETVIYNIILHKQDSLPLYKHTITY